MSKSRSMATICAFAAIGSALPDRAVSAGLNIDLRATHVNGQPLGAGSTPHHVVITQQSSYTYVSFEIYATVVGTNATLADDKFIGVSGSFVSAPSSAPGAGPMYGHLAADVLRTTTDPKSGVILTPGFDGPSFSTGLQQDLDLDGDLDVGSNVDSEAANFWSATWIFGGTGALAGSTSPTTGGVYIGSGSFVVSNNLVFGFAQIGFRGRDDSLAAAYVQDGQMIQSESIDGVVPIDVYGPWDPEPSGLAITVGAVALLRQRPQQLRRRAPVRRAK